MRRGGEKSARQCFERESTLGQGGMIMPDNHVYRIIQVPGSSENSIEDAIQNAVGRASRTLRQVGWFEVLETRPCRRRQGGALPGHAQSRVHARRRRRLTPRKARAALT